MRAPNDEIMREVQLNSGAKGNQLKRAISLAGSGPAAGLHIGALKKLAIFYL